MAAVTIPTTPLDEGFDRHVLQHVRPVLAAAGISPQQVECHSEGNGFDLDIHLGLPVPVAREVELALAVRALDAVAASGRRFAQVDVHVEPLPGPKVPAR